MVTSGLSNGEGGVVGGSLLVVSRVTDANLALWLEFAMQFNSNINTMPPNAIDDCRYAKIVTSLCQ